MCYILYQGEIFISYNVYSPTYIPSYCIFSEEELFIRLNAFLMSSYVYVAEFAYVSRRGKRDLSWKK